MKCISFLDENESIVKIDYDQIIGKKLALRQLFLDKPSNRVQTRIVLQSKEIYDS